MAAADTKSGSGPREADVLPREAADASPTRDASPWPTTAPATRSLARFRQPRETEKDEKRLSQRQKQIDYGKNTLGYARYLAEVPREKRTREQPWTPDKAQMCSKRSWDGQIRKWRRMLHQWDPEGGRKAHASASASSGDDCDCDEEIDVVGDPDALVDARPADDDAAVAVVDEPDVPVLERACVADADDDVDATTEAGAGRKARLLGEESRTGLDDVSKHSLPEVAAVTPRSSAADNVIPPDELPHISRLNWADIAEEDERDEQQQKERRRSGKRQPVPGAQDGSEGCAHADQQQPPAKVAKHSSPARAVPASSSSNCSTKRK
eukprot:m51a1_g10076 hypothetical protein (324) ;mRNA; r:39525-40967